MTPAHMMNAVAISEPGGPAVLQLQQWEVPPCGPDDVLIQVAAAGVNGPDTAQRAGHYDPPPGASPLPGLEVGGTIAAIGDNVTGFAVGDAVMALTNGGGYAEFVAVPVGQVLPAPQGWTTLEAAALPETWFTVTQTLVMRAGLEPGMDVLVHGAAGGIGGAAVQICDLLGARAIAVVSSPAKAAYARRLGAVATIDYTSEDIAARVNSLTDGKGVERVVDIVGGDMAAINVAASAIGGHIVQISTLAGGNAAVPLRAIMAKQLTLSGSTLRPQSAATKAAIAARLRRDLLPGLSSPGIAKPDMRFFPLDQAAEAHKVMESRTAMGKLVLVTPYGQQQMDS